MKGLDLSEHHYMCKAPVSPCLFMIFQYMYVYAKALEYLVRTYTDNQY